MSLILDASMSFVISRVIGMSMSQNHKLGILKSNLKHTHTLSLCINHSEGSLYIIAYFHALILHFFFFILHNVFFFLFFFWVKTMNKKNEET